MSARKRAVNVATWIIWCATFIPACVAGVVAGTLRGNGYRDAAEAVSAGASVLFLVSTVAMAANIVASMLPSGAES